MTDWVKAAVAADLEEDGMLGVVVEGQPIALYNIASRIFATDDICTHALAHLSDGFFDSDACTVECPLHAGRFDVETGAAVDGPVTEPVRTYETRIEGSDIMVRIGRLAPNVDR